MINECSISYPASGLESRAESILDDQDDEGKPA
jgi:hypothetical protein